MYYLNAANAEWMPNKLITLGTKIYIDDTLPAMYVAKLLPSGVPNTDFKWIAFVDTYVLKNLEQ